MDVYDQVFLPQPTEVTQSSSNDNESKQQQPIASLSSDPSSQEPKTDLDRDVEKLVGGITNWWSGIAKKSQDSFHQAKQHVESQGGIMNLAKKEYAKLESSLADAQKKAREASIATTNTTAATTIDTNENDESKLQPSDEKGKARQTEESSSSNVISPTTAPTTSFFSKLAADPRISHLQKSLLSLSLPGKDQQNNNNNIEGGSGTTAKKSLQETLATVTSTIQSHLPHLDLQQSQTLANKYLLATENVAKDVGKDMKEFFGDLVKIVPPEQSPSSFPTSQQQPHETESIQTNDRSIGSVPSSTNVSQVESTSVIPTDQSTIKEEEKTYQEEDDFTWDEEDDQDHTRQSLSKLQQPATLNNSSIDSDNHIDKLSKTKPEQKKDVVSTKDKDSNEDEHVDVDSDWE